MKLIEHLEHVIGLVDKQAPYTSIKTALIAMHQEIEGYEQSAANQATLKQEHANMIARLQEAHRAEIAQMTAGNARPKGDEIDEACKRMLVVIANTDGITRTDLIAWMGLGKVSGEYTFDQLRNREFIQPGLVGGPKGFPFHVGTKGRDYMARTNLLDAKPDRPYRPPPSPSAGFGRRQAF